MAIQTGPAVIDDTPPNRLLRCHSQEVSQNLQCLKYLRNYTLRIAWPLVLINKSVRKGAMILCQPNKAVARSMVVRSSTNPSFKQLGRREGCVLQQ